MTFSSLSSNGRKSSPFSRRSVGRFEETSSQRGSYLFYGPEWGEDSCGERERMGITIYPLSVPFILRFNENELPAIEDCNDYRPSEMRKKEGHM